MKFEPNRLPFWEIDRGGGPVTELVASRMRDRDAFAKRERVMLRGEAYVASICGENRPAIRKKKAKRGNG